MNINHTIKDSIFNILLDRITSRYYENGEQLIELDLAAEFNVSRSPVREAIRQLVAYDLATAIPHKGIFVKTLDDKKTIEIFEVRILIENHSISKLKDNMTDDIIEKITSIKNELNANADVVGNSDYINADEKLHSSLVIWGGNDTLTDFYLKKLSLVRYFSGTSLVDEDRFMAAIDEHNQIIDAIIDGDYQKACDVNSTHLQYALDIILKLSNERKALR